jgi:hypothetical protein
MQSLGKGVIGALLLIVVFSAGGRAAGVTPPSGTFVRWASIVGIIQPGNVVGGNTGASLPGVTGAGQPWTTLGGEAIVDLTNSDVEFAVRGLVLAGGSAIGTTGPVTQIMGTLVCNPGAATQAIINTAAVSLDAQGNASFKGSFSATTDACSATSVAFLITIPSGSWIANGAVAGSLQLGH